MCRTSGELCRSSSHTIAHEVLCARPGAYRLRQGLLVVALLVVLSNIDLSAASTGDAAREREADLQER